MKRRHACVLFLAVLLAHPVGAQESMTVVSEGVGKDIESAVQRAAEAALIQVVGSFIDSSKLVERQKEIRDGIRTQTKSITSKLSEYSQGSIERLDILEVEEDDGLTRVTAKVTVRIEDFKHYIKETVLAEKSIQKGLLGKMKVGRKQEANLGQLLADKVLAPLVDYGVVVPTLGDIEQVEDPEILKVINPGPDEFAIRFDVEVNLNPDYVSNAERVLRETATHRYEAHELPLERMEYSAAIGLGSGYGTKERSFRKSQHNSRSSLLRLSKGLFFTPAARLPGLAFPEDFADSPVFYIFDARNVRLCEALEGALDARSLETGAYDSMPVFPALRLQFLSSNGTVLRDEVLRMKSRSRLQSSYSVLVARDGTIRTFAFRPLQWSRTAFVPSLLHLGPEGRIYGENARTNQRKRVDQCSFFIATSTTFTIITRVSEEVLAGADRVVLSYTK